MSAFQSIVSPLPTLCCNACLNNDDVNVNCICIEINHLRQDIESFVLSDRSQNDDMNKKREAIIEMVINRRVPVEMYEQSPEWVALRESVHDYVQRVMDDADIDAPLNQVTCVAKAGRGHNHDFVFRVIDTSERNHELKVELKFNATSVSDAPQFVSPMKPAQYLSSSYEEFYYDNFLSVLTTMAGIPLPPKELYTKQIHGNKPSCIKVLQDKYYAGCRQSSRFSGRPEDVAFYTKANALSKESIAIFIGQNTLNIAKLGEYLKLTQDGKYYMLFKDGVFHMETVDMDEYELESVESEPSKSRFMVTTKTGRTLKVLLRWKNGNGIAYPAFQIS